ncbi:MAG TPA: hypothetical protein VHK27_07150, partial [Gammaproteobacteria bacterium]|nr:hypothetical protein [Gammaproteobacteria bacterium]
MLICSFSCARGLLADIVDLPIVGDIGLLDERQRRRIFNLGQGFERCPALTLRLQGQSLLTV